MGSACEMAHTDIENQSFRRRFRCVDFERAHASDDWADEVDIEYGDQIDNMEDDGQAEKGHATEWRHDVEKRVWYSFLASCLTYKVFFELHCTLTFPTMVNAPSNRVHGQTSPKYYLDID